MSLGQKYLASEAVRQLLLFKWLGEGSSHPTMLLKMQGVDQLLSPKSQLT